VRQHHPPSQDGGFDRRPVRPGKPRQQVEREPLEALGRRLAEPGRGLGEQAGGVEAVGHVVAEPLQRGDDRSAGRVTLLLSQRLAQRRDACLGAARRQPVRGTGARLALAIGQQRLDRGVDIGGAGEQVARPLA
jgi:hypothetical protein